MQLFLNHSVSHTNFQHPKDNAQNKSGVPIETKMTERGSERERENKRKKCRFQ